MKRPGLIGLNGGAPWLIGTNGAFCFICKNEVENITHFSLVWPNFRNSFDLLCNDLEMKILDHSATDRTPIAKKKRGSSRKYETTEALFLSQL